MKTTCHCIFGLDSTTLTTVSKWMAFGVACACAPFHSFSAAEQPLSSYPANGPVSADGSLRHFRVHPHVRIELVAAEPEVIDPVAMAFDEFERLWVVEMRDYPNGPDEGEPPESRIVVLEDHDGDGRYETSRVFAERLLFPTGLQPWRGGVIVTLAGEVAWMKDTDGDGRADFHESWFTGFAEQNPQLRANHPTFAVDNRVYIANGLRGGDVVSRNEAWSNDAQPISISGMDFRFDPRGGRYEAVSGNGQFGLTFDSFGNRFVCSNRNPCQHVILEDRYLKRNPYLVATSVSYDVSPAGAQSRVFPISRTWTTSNLHAGQFTAACGVSVYGGDQLPREFAGNVFVCEPTGNLVHRDVLRRQGLTFSSRASRENVEFLASTDPWFRPVNLAHGPDGGLYIVDMYRAVIEHPEWVPDELKDRRDTHFGNDRGRIYRIVSAASEQAATQRTPRLKEMTSTELAKVLEHPNSWHRETAARLLYQRQDAAAADALVRLARYGKTPESRLYALWSLDGLGVLQPDHVRVALADRNAAVRSTAVRLAEPWLLNDDALRIAVAGLAEDEEASVRFQVASSTGETSLDSVLLRALAAIGLRDADNPWTRLAIASSCAERPVDVLKALFDRIPRGRGANAKSAAAQVRLLAEVAGARQNKREVAEAIDLVATSSGPRDTRRLGHSPFVEFALLGGLGDGLQRRGSSLQSHVSELTVESRNRLSGVFYDAARIARNVDGSSELQLAAVDLLRHSDYDVAGPVLKELALPGFSQGLRLAALDSLGAFDAADVAEELLLRYNAETPPVRRMILDVLLTRDSHTELLLDEIARGRMSAAELDPSRQKRLTQNRNAEIRRRARDLVGAVVSADRRQVLDEYQAALTANSDPREGRAVFQKNCATCHRIGNDGIDTGPDISDSRDKLPAQILVSILDPNRAVDGNYFGYNVVTTDGVVLSGIIVSETASSVTLRQEEGKTQTVLRSNIEEMRSSGASFMPIGFEKNISVQQMAELVSYIKNWRYLDGQVPVKAIE